MNYANLAITFGSLVIANICSSLMVQAESRNRAHLAGAFEGGWGLLYIVAAKYTLVGINPSDWVGTTAMLTDVFVGNYLGAYLGTKIGERFVADHSDRLRDDRLSETEAALALAEMTLRELNNEIAVHHDHEGHDHENL